MRKIEREPNGAGIFKPGQDLVVAGTVGKNGVKAALIGKKKKRVISPIPGSSGLSNGIREQADKKSELTPEMLDAAVQENGKRFRRAAYWPPFGPYRELTSRGFPLN